MCAVRAGASRGAGSNPVAALLEHYAAECPKKIFVESIDQECSITWEQFKHVTDKFAVYLQRAGIGRNDRIALLAENSLEHLLVMFGVLRYGASICKVNLEANLAYVGDILKAARPRLALFEDPALLEKHQAPDGSRLELGRWHPEAPTGLFARLANLPGESASPPINEASDEAFITYTSGTTAKPKGVVSHYDDCLRMMEGQAERFAFTPSDRLLEFRSLNWVSGLSHTLSAAHRGATILLGRRFSRHRYFDWIKQYQATIAVGNPTIIAMLLSEPVNVSAADVPQLRFITSSSAPLPLEHWRAFEKRYGITVAQGYGVSEAICFVATSNEKTLRFGSVGIPIESQNLRIVRGDGSAAAPREQGEVEIGGPDRKYRYLDYDGTVKVVATGRFRTGDIGYLDEDGYLYLTGRVRDLIIRGGVNIAPAEIEGVLLQAPGVAEAAAIGIPDPIYGQQVVAYVTGKPGISLSEQSLLARCAETLPRLKQPKAIIVKEALPKNNQGKVARKQLLEDWKSKLQ